MNAFAHDQFCPPGLQQAMVRDLLGGGATPRPRATVHLALSSLDTGGPLGLLDSTAPAGTVVRRHAHPAEDELIIVLSGELEVCVGNSILRRGPGTSAFIPRGTEHGLRALSEVRTLAVLTRDSLETPAT